MKTFSTFLFEKKNSTRLSPKEVKVAKKKAHKHAVEVKKTGSSSYHIDDDHAPVVHLKDPKDLVKHFGAKSLKQQVKKVHKMKFEEFILEKELTPAQKKAQELGLKYRGFGYWQNPITGKTEYKTVGDDLVPIDQEEETDLDDENQDITMGDPLGQKEEQPTLTTPPGTNVLGAPAPGQERPSEDATGPNELGWNAGPDGDNMVNDQNKKEEDELPSDTYVGSNNNFSWVAGPDGSNFKNLSFDKMVDEASHYITEVNRSQRTQGVKEKYPGLSTKNAEVVARNRRHGAKVIDAGYTTWHQPGPGETEVARKAAKRNRDRQQDASDDSHAKAQGKKHDPRERTSHWQRRGDGKQTAHVIAKNIRAANKEEKKEKNASVPKGMHDEIMHLDKDTSWKGPMQAALDNLRAGGGFTDHEDPHDSVMNDLKSLLGEPSNPKSYLGAKTLIDYLKNDPTGGGPQIKQAAQDLAKLGTTDRENELQSLERIANLPDEPPKPGWGSAWAKTGHHRAQVVRNRLKALPTFPQRKKDRERVKKMNEDLREMLTNPDQDLSYEGLRQLGEGSFGAAYLGRTGDHVIKNGHIGAKELKAMHKLKDSPYFPTLLNALFTSPFSNQSSERNNPDANPYLARKPGEENYPMEDGDTWSLSSLGPTAEGTYAMSLANGRPWSRVRDEERYSTDMSQRAANIWRAREALHRAGFSHNDMHGSNIFMDDEGNPTILDLGLANDDPMSALQEALGGISDEDYQLATGARFEDLPDDIREKIRANIINVGAQMRERLGLDDSYDEDYNNFLNGGIRLKEDELKDMRKQFNFTDDEILDYISQIYDGLTPKEQTELERRMSAAYDKRAADSEVLGNANKVRQFKGKQPLRFNNVVPERNLDRSFDHDD